MGDFLAAVRVFHGEIEGLRIDVLHIHAPAFRRVGEVLLPVNKVSEVGIIQRIRLPHVAAGIELVEPDLPGGCAFFKKQDDRFHAGTDEGAAGAVEHGVEIAAFQEQLAQGDGGVVRVGKEGILDDDAAAPAGLEQLDEVLEEEEGGLAGADREILLDLLALLAAEGGGLAMTMSKRSFCWMSARFSARVLVWTMFGASMPWRIMFITPMT